MPDFIKNFFAKDAGKKVGILIASQAPLGIILWWVQAQQNPILAFICSLIYEAFVIPAGLFLKAFAEEFKRIPTEKAPIAGKQAAQWLWVRIPIASKRAAGWVWDRISVEFVFLFSGFRRRYARWLIREYGVFNVKGLAKSSAYDLNLEGIFVELKINTESNPSKPIYNPLAEKNIDTVQSHSIWTLLRSEAFKDAVMVIKGQLGSGKTTLLQYVALAMVKGRRNRAGLRLHFPILLFLRNHIREITDSDNPPTLGELAQDYFSKPENVNDPDWKKPPANWFEKKLKRNRCLVLLDGYDEIGDKEKRKKMATWVSQQNRKYTNARFILSSRPGGYNEAPLERANQLDVLPFSPSQVERFVENWYLATGIMKAGGKRNRDVELRASTEAKNLIKTLAKSENLRDLTTNPLLLTMLVMVHSYTGVLPGSRVDLYADIFQVLLGKWQLTKGLPDNLRAEQKLLVLQKLAAYMMENQLRVVESAQALRIMTPVLQSVGLETSKIENFLVDTQNGSGLLIERELGLWSFAHISFQEYLTACEWLNSNDILDCQNLVEVAWWHETLRLYAAKADGTVIIEACLNNGSFEALTLMIDCLEGSIKIRQDVREKAEKSLNGAIESTEPELFSLAANVYLNRRLRKFQTLNDTTAIDPGFVTCSEYQLFLDAMDADKNLYKPYHWKSNRFEAGKAHEPVVGVSWFAARRFVMWLNIWSGTGHVYRVPDQKEINQNINQELDLTFWCGADKDVVKQSPKYGIVQLNAKQKKVMQHWLQSNNWLKEIPLPENILPFFASYIELAIERIVQRNSVFKLGRVLFPFYVVLALEGENALKLSVGMFKKPSVGTSSMQPIYTILSDLGNFPKNYKRVIINGDVEGLSSRAYQIASELLSLIILIEKFEPFDIYNVTRLTKQRLKNVAKEGLKKGNIEFPQALLEAMEARNFSACYYLIDLLLKSDLAQKHLNYSFMLIKCLLKIVEGKSLTEQQQALSQYTALICGYLYIGSNLEKNSPLSPFSKVLFTKPPFFSFLSKGIFGVSPNPFYSPGGKPIEIYWQLRLIHAYTTNELVATQGIKLVREKGEQ